MVRSRPAQQVEVVQARGSGARCRPSGLLDTDEGGVAASGQPHSRDRRRTRRLRRGSGSAPRAHHRGWQPRGVPQAFTVESDTARVLIPLRPEVSSACPMRAACRPHRQPNRRRWHARAGDDCGARNAVRLRVRRTAAGVTAHAVRERCSMSEILVAGATGNAGEHVLPLSGRGRNVAARGGPRPEQRLAARRRSRSYVAIRPLRKRSPALRDALAAQQTPASTGGTGSVRS